MTTKYESVLSDAELAELCGVEVGNPNYLVIISIAKHVQQATLAKLQPQLDAIGAGGVSGQRVSLGGQPFRKQPEIRPTDDDLWDQTVSDRDHNEERANKLANAIAKYFGEDIGEHTSANCPWRNALEVIENSDKRLADALYQAVEKELLDIEMCFENFVTPQQAINALIEWHVNVPKELSLKAYQNEKPVCYVEPACTIEGMGGYGVCKDGDGFPVYRYPHIPEGYKLVPIELTEDMVDASGCEGQFKISPSDQAQRLWSAMLSASPTPDIKDSLTTENQELRIVFSGEAPNLTFIDVENEDGFSVNVGKWHKRFDGYTELRIKAAKE